jgi:outer membrane protein assembly factor BamB
VIHDGGFFRCYDATNGALKWEIPGVKQTTDVVTADIDGDGRPEFLAGLAAFKPIDQTHGRVVWEVDVPAAHSPVVADVDGDGKCEIVICGTDGVLRVFK